ncbi:hypothetical protein [Mesorhizobium sp. M0520]|uniref:hypothetical protein n=1 Tax=Mesorhizobium sp. M0520 TaxID=2956957 RepID=UPI003334EC43
MFGEPITVLMVNEYPDYIDSQAWAAELKTRVPQLEFRLWPDAGNKSDIDIVLIDKGASPGFFDAMTGLSAVVYLGAGVDAIDLQGFPKSVPLIRLATREQASEVVQYIVLRVLCQQRHVANYMTLQARKVWNPIAPRDLRDKNCCAGCGPDRWLGRKAVCGLWLRHGSLVSSSKDASWYT